MLHRYDFQSPNGRKGVIYCNDKLSKEIIEGLKQVMITERNALGIKIIDAEENTSFEYDNLTIERLEQVMNDLFKPLHDQRITDIDLSTPKTTEKTMKSLQTNRFWETGYDILNPVFTKPAAMTDHDYEIEMERISRRMEEFKKNRQIFEVPFNKDKDATQD